MITEQIREQALSEMRYERGQAAARTEWLCWCAHRCEVYNCPECARRHPGSPSGRYLLAAIYNGLDELQDRPEPQYTQIDHYP